MKNIQMMTHSLFEAGHTLAWKYLEKTTYPWEIFGDLKTIIC